MDDLIIVESFWDKRLVRDNQGKEFEILRGSDYDVEWQRLGYGYSKDLKGVYLWDKECFRKYKKEIDISSLVLIQANKSENTFYFKDKNSVYIDSYMADQVIIEDANPDSFNLIDIDLGYSTSNGKDYWYDFELPYTLHDLVHINQSYQKVGNSIYFGHIQKVACDSETFEIINEKAPTVARDKNHVYFKSDIIEGANPQTFKFIEDCIADDSPHYLECDIHFYAKDDTFAYFINVPFGFKIIRTKDLNNFKFIVKDGIGYGIDSTYYYEKGKRKKLE